MNSITRFPFLSKFFRAGPARPRTPGSVTPWLIGRWFGYGLLSCAALLAGPRVEAFFAEGAGDRNIERGRSIYRELTAAARRGDWRRVDDLRAMLDAYPLASYADYERLMVRLDDTPGTQARVFVDAHERSPLGVRYLGHYLNAAGRDRRWGDLLAAADREPRSEKLRCYYARAKRGRGQEREAWELASRLFLSGSSVDKACDPLFRLWREQGGPGDALLWSRAKLAFRARERGLLRYLASLGGPTEAMEVLQQVYREPQRTPALTQNLAPPYRAEVAALGLERHSRYDPAQALRQYEALDQGLLDASQRSRVEVAIAFRALLERDEAVRAWIDRSLPRWRDDKLTELRLRWAIAELDWPSLLANADALTERARGQGEWRYWRARALGALGDAESERSLLSALAQERSFYGFLAADRSGEAYQFASESAAPWSEDQLPDWVREAAWRVHELTAIEQHRLAHAEWSHAIQRVVPEQRLALAQLAEEQGWYRLAIDAANAGDAWNHLDLRFPLAWTDAFAERARRRDVAASELMAIARRESAFFPAARSPAGARGLMQLMPSTGIAVARSTGLRLDVGELYEVEHNLDLGSAYYRQLLDRFDGNRAVALAAYNAGPNRVQHWVGTELPVDAWIATIPYRETRDYVQAVLAYTVVFDHRMGNEPALLSDAERHARY
jgi:soluble lytic murein transglycosylase